jgi:hypothetical protein
MSSIDNCQLENLNLGKETLYEYESFQIWATMVNGNYNISVLFLSLINKSFLNSQLQYQRLVFFFFNFEVGGLAMIQNGITTSQSKTLVCCFYQVPLPFHLPTILIFCHLAPLWSTPSPLLDFHWGISLSLHCYCNWNHHYDSSKFF